MTGSSIRFGPVTALLALLIFAATVPATAQTGVPVHEEPRHRLVHDEDGFRVLDVLIQPGDTTLFHIHAEAIAYVAVGPAPVNQQVLGREWGTPPPPGRAPVGGLGRVTFNERYPDTPVTHRVTAVGDRPFRLIAVVNRGAGTTPSGEESLGSAGAVESDRRFFRTARVTVEPGEGWSWAPHDRPVVAVQVSAGALEAVVPGGRDGRTGAIGDFLVLPAGGAVGVTNRSTEPVTLALVEVR